MAKAESRFAHLDTEPVCREDKLIEFITDEKNSARLAAFIIPFAALYMVGHVVKACFF